MSWRSYASGIRRREFHWDSGHPANQWQWWDEDGRLSATVDFEQGLPVRINGSAIAQFTLRVIQAPQAVQSWLGANGLINQETTTFDQVVLRDRRAPRPAAEINRFLVTHKSFDHPVRVQLSEMPLRVGLLFMLHETGLVLDYRYDQLLITTADDARTWTDRTGVSDLQPPPDSAWAQALDSQVGVEFHDASPLWSAELQAQFGVKLQVDERVPMLPPGAAVPVSIDDVRRSLRVWLHRLLGRENLTCRLDGDTLIIEPLD